MMNIICNELGNPTVWIMINEPPLINNAFKISNYAKNFKNVVFFNEDAITH